MATEGATQAAADVTAAGKINRCKNTALLKRQ
jgi:hypothetical protein